MAPKPQENIPVALASDAHNLNNNNNNNGYVNNAFENDLNNKLAVVALDDMNTNNNNNNNNKLDLDSAKKDKPMIDFDDLLPHLGEFGRYQKILFILMIPFAFFVAFVYFAQIFMTLVPEEHWCKIPELEHLTKQERVALAIPSMNDGFSKCSMYAVNFTEKLAEGIKEADPSWPVQPCKFGWEFNFTDVPYETIATELEWVCDDATLPTIAQSIFFLGAIVGGLLFGWIADRYGRVPALVGCNSIGFVAGVLTAFVGSFWQFSLCRFLVGFAFDNCFTMMYILVLEYVGPKWRTFVANMSIAIFFTFATCALPWIAVGLGDWKWLAIATSAPLALAIFTPYVVPESARWLVSQGKIDKAITILKKFERINGKEIQPQMYEDFRDSCLKIQEEEAEISNYSVLDLFKTPHLRKITILMIIIWGSISLVFDGHVRNVGSLGLDFFFTFTVAAATEFPADTLLTLTLDKWGRRWLACGSLVASGIFSLLATCVPLGAVSATLAICGRFSVNISYNIGLQYAAELLPTVVRAQGVAFIHIMGYVASIISPFIVYLANIHTTLPLIILGVLGIVSGLVSLMLPETLGQELPQTLADGEQFGRNQKFWEFPCCKKVSDDVTDEKEVQPYFRRAVTSQSSLRSVSRGEIQSSMLRRSVRNKNLGKSMA